MRVKQGSLIALWAFYDGVVRADPHAAFVDRTSHPTWIQRDKTSFDCDKYNHPIHQVYHTHTNTRQSDTSILSYRGQPLHLFFASNRQARQTLWTIPDESLTQLSQRSVSFPFSIQLQYNGPNQLVAPTKTSLSEFTSKRLLLRNLETTDLSIVVPMCVKEFGTPTTITGFPWKHLTKDTIQAWFDSVLFGPLIHMSLEMKIQSQLHGEALQQPDDTILCLEENGKIVGIVELSIQPLDPERNPPPVPFPSWYKEAYSQSKNIPPPNGWVTNLLIANDCRGLGYSKVMMKAAEGLARSWGCTSVSLHVNADQSTGHIAQQLYKSLGYTPVVANTSNDIKYNWMGPELLQMGLYMIDGVPLLFLRKDLKLETPLTV